MDFLRFSRSFAGGFLLFSALFCTQSFADFTSELFGASSSAPSGDLANKSVYEAAEFEGWDEENSPALSQMASSKAQIFSTTEAGAQVAMPGAKVGETGVIVHKIDAENETIIARAKVVATDGEVASLEFFTFADIAQMAMPVPILRPEDGDEFLNRFLYQNAVLIAPSEAAYDADAARLAAQGINLIAPELLAQLAYGQGKNRPTRNDLRNFCTLWALGRVFVSYEGALSEYDCATLQRLSATERAVSEQPAAGEAGSAEAGESEAGEAGEAAGESDEAVGSAEAGEAGEKAAVGLNFYSAISRPGKDFDGYFKRLLERDLLSGDKAAD